MTFHCYYNYSVKSLSKLIKKLEINIKIITGIKQIKEALTSKAN
jgi:hypothetical protein